jgi:hypothetical protein
LQTGYSTLPFDPQRTYQSITEYAYEAADNLMQCLRERLGHNDLEDPLSDLERRHTRSFAECMALWTMGTQSNPLREIAEVSYLSFPLFGTYLS